MAPNSRPSARPHNRLRAIALGALLALVAFEAVLQITAYVLWRTADREAGTHGDRAAVLCIGDSFTYGLGASDPSRSYPAQLQQELDAARPDTFHVVNAGRPGQSTADILRRLPRQIAAHRPAWVIVMAGYNDRWKKPAPVDAASLAETPAAEPFPLRLRTLELASRIVGAITADAPGAAPPPGDLYGSWHGDGLLVRFGRDGVCLVSGIQAAYRIDGDRIEIGDGDAAFRLTWERIGEALRLRGDALPGGDVELLRVTDDTAAAPNQVGRRILEDTAAVDALDEAAVADACSILAEQPGESPLWWSTAAAAARGIGADLVLETVAGALDDLGPDDPWRAGLLRIRGGILEARDPDAALAAILAAALIDGQVETVASFIETRSKDAPRAAFDRAVALLQPGDRDRARLDAMFAQAVVPEDRLAETIATHLELTVRLCHDANCEVIVATYPEREPVVDRAIRDGARRTGLAMVDVSAAFDTARATTARDALFVMDGHCNDAGYALVAETIAGRLLGRAPR